MLGLKGKLGAGLTRLVMKILEIDKCNSYQARHPEDNAPDFAKHILEDVGVRYELPEGQLDRIPADIPHTLRELARLREIVFRAVGEGSGNALDTDIYDTYYKHLIVWNVPKQEIAGAYRIGFGDEVMARAEKENAFYTSTLFQFQKDLLPYLPKAMELGRTIGPVSTTNDLPLFYKSLAYHFILKHYSLPEADQLIRPTHPLHPDFLRVDPDQLLVNCHSVDDLDRLVCTLSDGRFRLPVLLRKYISFGANILDFNLDPDFNDCVDGFVLLDFKNAPENTFRAFSRFLTVEEQKMR